VRNVNGITPNAGSRKTLLAILDDETLSPKERHEALVGPVQVERLGMHQNSSRNANCIKRGVVSVE
jgi:hypothetical protein